MGDNRIMLRCLSGAWVEGATADAEGNLRITARKKVALLAYLALDRQSAPRDLLAGLIWGDVPDAKARASLRQALSELRAAHPVLQQALVIDRTTVSLVPGHIDIETDAIVDQVTSGQMPPQLRAGGETVNDILYGFETIGERYADWVRDIRKACSDRILQALTTTANRVDLPAALRIDLAEAALMLDPLSERNCRAAMQLALGLGDTGKALQIYSTFYARMEAELDMEPSLETQDLAVSIKLNGIEASEAQATTPTSSPTAPTVPPHRNHGRPTLAVLPMQATGSEPIDDYLPELLVDNLVLRITRTRDISVISRVSIRHLSERPDIAQVLLHELGVRYIISGHIRRQGDVYHLNVELSKTDEGVVLWVDRYQTTLPDLEDAQSRIADEVVNRILPNLQGAELSDARLIDVAHLSAYQKLLRAQELIYTLSQPKFEEAGRQLIQTIADWPDFTPARVSLGDWHSLRVGQGWSDGAANDLAQLETQLEAALKSDRRNGRALAMLGHNKAVYARRPAEAKALFDEALSAAPGDAETLLWTGPSLAFSGQADAAIERLEHAHSLNFDNPLGFRYDHFRAIAYFAADRMEDAMALGLASAQRNGRYTSNLRLTAAAAAAIQKNDVAHEMAARVLSLEPDFKIAPLVAESPFYDPAKRAQYGQLLFAAGLPS